MESPRRYYLNSSVSARHSSWSGCAWLQAWWQALFNSHRTNCKQANWHKFITWRFTSQLCALCTECMTWSQNGNCMNIVRICDCSVFRQCAWLLLRGVDTPMSLQRDRSGDRILVIFYTVNREHGMLLFKDITDFLYVWMLVSLRNLLTTSVIPNIVCVLTFRRLMSTIVDVPHR